MDYRITGLDPKPFEHIFALDDAGLARHRAVRRAARIDRA